MPDNVLLNTLLSSRCGLEFLNGSVKQSMTNDKPLQSTGYKVQSKGSEFRQFIFHLISRILNFQHNFIEKLDAKSKTGH